MPTVRTVTVKSSGGDYSSLNSAEAGEQGDLVSLDRQLDIECHALSDTSSLTITGWTTDATRYIRVFTTSAARHAGVWDSGKYVLSTGSVATRVLTNNEDFVRFEGLQIEHTNATPSNRRAGIQVASTSDAANSDVRITSCIIRNCGTSNVDVASGLVTVRNCAIYGGVANGLQVATGTLVADNCTSAGNGARGFERITGTATLQNCYSGGNTTADYNGTITRTTCAHSSATSYSGSTASIAHDTSNFTNVTAGSQDYHLVSGASATLLSGGTDLSGTFTDDIDGDTRSDWSIGADEYVSAGGLSIPIAMHHYKQMMGVN